jgi:hypothetical protein
LALQRKNLDQDKYNLEERKTVNQIYERRERKRERERAAISILKGPVQLTILLTTDLD